MRYIFSFLLCCILCFPGHRVWAQAEDVQALRQELEQMKSDLQKMQDHYAETIQQMQNRIDTLESQDQINNLEVKVQKLEETQKASSGVLGKMGMDFSVIGDTVFHWTDKKDDDLVNQFNFRELELAFSGNVDTYARGDVFLAVENEGGTTKVNLEEAYLTLLETPVDNLQLKMGKFRPAFGKTNRMHTHSLAWADYPKVIQNYFGEEGFSGHGASATYLLPNPWDIYSEVTLEVLNNDNATLFAGTDGRDVGPLVHWKNFFDRDGESTLELGGSLLAAPNMTGKRSIQTRVEGVDLTYKWRPAQEGLYRSLTFQNEILFSHKEQDLADTIDSWGMYSSLEHQFAQRWSAFGRFDYAQTPANSDALQQGYSVGLTFKQSEYAFWRLQFEHTERPEGLKDSDEVWLQLNFGLGPHRAHTY